MIKSVVDREEKHSGWNYPCLGIAKDGLIVLFSAEEVGVVIRPSDDYRCGYYADDWDMVCFTPFTGTVTLSNE